MKRIYLIQAEDTELYKIGLTSGSVKKRIKELQTGNSHKLIEVASFETSNGYLLESILHKFFTAHRLEGEWFKLSELQVKDFIDRCKSQEEMLNFFKKNTTLKKPF